MVRIIVIGAGIAATVVGGILFKRTLGAGLNVPSWPGMPIPRMRSQKLLQQQQTSEGHQGDNGVFYRD